MTTLKPLWPLVRRLRALRALGISVSTICAETGLDSFQVEMVLDFTHAEIDPKVDAAIRKFYQHHQSDEYNPDENDKKLIWPVPYDWENIDNPKELVFPSRLFVRGRPKDGPYQGEDGFWRNLMGRHFCARGHLYYDWNVVIHGSTVTCRACRNAGKAWSYDKTQCIEKLSENYYQDMLKQSEAKGVEDVREVA